jgi:hypothetical protein
LTLAQTLAYRNSHQSAKRNPKKKKSKKNKKTSQVYITTKVIQVVAKFWVKYVDKVSPEKQLVFNISYFLFPILFCYHTTQKIYCILYTNTNTITKTAKNQTLIIKNKSIV